MIETDEHQIFRKTLRDLFEREIEPHVDAWEAARIFPAHDLFPKLAAVGLLGLEYEEAYGGMAADPTFTLVAGEEMGRISCGGVPMAIAVQMSMATPALARYGSAALKEEYLAPSIRGELVASVAVTEPDAGSDVAGIRTRAVRDGDQWVVNGSKLYITNGTQADWLCLLARTSEDGGHRGMSLIVVPTSLDGVVVSRKLEKLGMWSSDTAELSFTDVRVPVSHTIGEIGRGFQQQMVQFQAERLITVYKQVGAIELALQRTRSTCWNGRLSASPCWPTSIFSSCWPSCRPATTCSSSTPVPRRMPWHAGRMPPASPRSASCWAHDCNVKWPMSPCNSTEGSRTWPSTGLRASTATRGSTPSGRGPMKSCCACFPEWTATRSNSWDARRRAGASPTCRA